MSEGEIIWNSDMSVGIDALDDDHKILVSYLNEFIGACDKDEGIFVTDSIFSGLLEYTNYHFVREEKIMKVCGYSGYEAHKELHQVLTEKVIDARDRFILNRSGDLEVEIKDFLQSWLQEHILGSDMDYVSDCVGKEKEIAAALKD
ncbi:MAG: hemerythrin family protein [Rhodospirillaceae bacterium]|jgi:hemerythrin-like metal-binding protein|nr:hemerythrin family protein [Rhodospirillaceae bacterium]MBT4463976.1 hemerythrin family protein [Rhodospirillaceae bacterium]